MSQKSRPKIAASVSNATVSTQKSFFSQTAKYAIFLAILSFCLYANTLKNGYVLDDQNAIQHNFLVKKGLSALPNIFVTPYHFGNHNELAFTPPPRK